MTIAYKQSWLLYHNANKQNTSLTPAAAPDMAKVMAKVAEMAQQFALLAASLSTC